MKEKDSAPTTLQRAIIKQFRISKPVEVRVHDEQDTMPLFPGNMVADQGSTYYMSIKKSDATDPLDFTYQAASVKLMDDGETYSVRQSRAKHNYFGLFKAIDDPIHHLARIMKIHQYFPQYLAQATEHLAESLMDGHIDLPKTHVLNEAYNANQRLSLLTFYAILGPENVDIPIPPEWRHYVSQTIRLLADMHQEGFSLRKYNTYLKALNAPFRLRRIRISWPIAIYHCEIVDAPARTSPPKEQR